jgi:malate dehydrogenase (oxaloacetate-decarboxylating)(NADP+)
MYIFPGLGLAASVAGIKRITDKMLYTAAVACADSMTPECVAEGRTFPKIQNIREGELCCYPRLVPPICRLYHRTAAVCAWY